MTATYDIVIPSVGRPSLAALLDSLAADDGPGAGRTIVVDDRAAVPADATDDPVAAISSQHRTVEVIRSGGRGPAAARNLGWRTATAPWIAFLDDDVVVEAGWGRRLADDLDRASPIVAGVQGGVEVPMDPARRPTDWERNVAGLADARWITADLAYRRCALEAAEGFDPRFGRAYREDADLALRLLRAGWELQVGERRVRHPVPPAPWWISLVKQAGNADDALMRRLHGRRWRRDVGAGPSRLAWHLATTAALAGAAVAVAEDRRGAARVLSAVGAGLTVELAARRIAAGPLAPAEVAAMAATSVVLPHLAVAHRVRGEVSARLRVRPVKAAR